MSNGVTGGCPGAHQVFLPTFCGSAHQQCRIAPFFTSCPSPSDTPPFLGAHGGWHSWGTTFWSLDCILPGLTCQGVAWGALAPDQGLSLRSPSREHRSTRYGTSPSSGTGTDYSHTHHHRIRTASLHCPAAWPPQRILMHNLSPVSWCGQDRLDG